MGSPTGRESERWITMSAQLVSLYGSRSSAKESL